MNLADAIRNAALGGEPYPSTPEGNAEPEPELAPLPSEVKKKGKAKPPTEQLMSEPTHNPAGNIVRLELCLTAEQIAMLFKSIVTGQHTVMTLREAAAHLRVPPHALETMAQESEVPAFQIDGRWRFSRAALDDWLTSRPQEWKESEAA